MEHLLCASLLAKIEEQIERTDHLVTLLPPGEMEWRPPFTDGFSVAVLLGHLLDCLAGFCAVLYRVAPERLGRFLELKSLPVNQPCGPGETRGHIGTYRAAIREGYALLRDDDLKRLVPTVFVPAGESVLTLLLGNLEHLINHKYQLFTYLKLMKVEVASQDLYHFRG